MIPPDIFIALTLTVLFLVQNTKQLIPQSKAQIRIAVIKLSVIKGRVFGKPIENCIPSCFSRTVFLSSVSRLRPLSDGHLQDFPLAFFKVGSAVFLPQDRELGILQINLFLGKCCNLIFIRTDIHHIALIVEVAKWVQLP